MLPIAITHLKCTVAKNHKGKEGDASSEENECPKIANQYYAFEVVWPGVGLKKMITKLFLFHLQLRRYSNYRR